MPYSFQEYTAQAGVLGPFALPFSALDITHYKAQINGVAEADFSITGDWASGDGQLTFGPTVTFAGGETVRVYRDTPQEALVDFASGSPVLEQDLDTLTYQDTYRDQEGRDYSDEIQEDLITAQLQLSAHIYADSPHLGHENKVSKGLPNGYAGLDAAGHVPAAQLGTGAVGDGSRILADDNTFIEIPAVVGSGEVNTLGDSGTGDETLVATPAKVAAELKTKRITAGAGISLSSDDDQVTITSTASGAGEVNVLADAGTGEASLIKAKTGSTLNVRKLKQGAGVTLTEGTDDVTIDTDGEPNTLSDSGSGESLILAKVGDALGIKKLEASGTHITLTPTATSVQISSDGEANTLADSGTGTSLIKAKVAEALGIKKLAEGTNVTLVDDGEVVTISTANPAGEANTLADTGAGSSLIKAKVGTALGIKKIIAGTGASLAESADGITINTTCEATTIADGGAGTTLIQTPPKVGAALQIKSLVAGSGVSLAADATTVTISSPGASGEANTLADTGSGESLIKAKTGTVLNLKKVAASGGNITLTPSTDTLTIGLTPGAWEANTIAGSGLGDASLIPTVSKVGVQLKVKDISAGTGVTLDVTEDDITINAPGVGEANTLGDTGAGETLIKAKTGSVLNLKRIIAGTGVTLTPSTDGLQIDATGVGGGEVNTASSPAASGISIQHATPKSGTDLQFRKLVAGNGMDISSTGTDQVTVATLAPTIEKPIALTRTEAAIWKRAGVIGFGRYGTPESPNFDGDQILSADDASGPRATFSTNTTVFSVGSNLLGACGVRSRPTYLQRRWSPNVAFDRVQISQADLTFTRAYIGCFDQNYMYGKSTMNGINGAGFRFDSGVHASLMYAITNDGSATATETQISGSTPLSEHQYRIKMESGQVLFYIDDVLVATHTTKLPTSTQPLNLTCSIEYLGGGVLRRIAWARTFYNHE